MSDNKTSSQIDNNNDDENDLPNPSSPDISLDIHTCQDEEIDEQVIEGSEEQDEGRQGEYKSDDKDKEHTVRHDLPLGKEQGPHPPPPQLMPLGQKCLSREWGKLVSRQQVWYSEGHLQQRTKEQDLLPQNQLQRRSQVQDCSTQLPPLRADRQRWFSQEQLHLQSHVHGQSPDGHLQQRPHRQDWLIQGWVQQHERPQGQDWFTQQQPQKHSSGYSQGPSVYPQGPGKYPEGPGVYPQWQLQQQLHGQDLYPQVQLPERPQGQDGFGLKQSLPQGQDAYCHYYGSRENYGSREQPLQQTIGLPQPPQKPRLPQDSLEYIIKEFSGTSGDKYSYEKVDRKTLVLIVTIIIFIMVLATIAFLLIIQLIRKVKNFFLISFLYVVFLSMISIVIVGFIMASTAWARRRPANYICLIILVIFVCLLCGAVSSLYAMPVVLYAFIATIVCMIISLILSHTHTHTQCDFTKCILFVTIIAATIFAMAILCSIWYVGTGFYSKIPLLVLLGIFAPVVMMTLTMTLQTAFGDKSMDLDEADHALAAFMVYACIMGLYLTFVRLIGIAIE